MGKIGCWVENLEIYENLSLKENWEKIIAQSIESGFSWLAIKHGDVYLNSQMAQFIEFGGLEKAHQAGLKIFTWNFSKPNSVEKEIDVISNNQKKGFDGHIFVLSQDWVNQKTYFNLINSKLNNKSYLAGCAFPINLAKNYEPLYESFDFLMPFISKTSVDSLDTLQGINHGTIIPVLDAVNSENISNIFSNFGSLDFSLSSYDNLFKLDLFNDLISNSSLNKLNLEKNKSIENDESNEDLDIIEGPEENI